jgi:hypothetical protein
MLKRDNIYDVRVKTFAMVTLLSGFGPYGIFMTVCLILL